jgi:hypothetical protein
MIRIRVAFRRSDRGMFSHFAHFICDFAIPLFALFRERNLLSNLMGDGVVLEMQNRNFLQFGPMLPFVREVFPNLQLNYLSRFESEPAVLCQQSWYNRPEDIQSFLDYLIDLFHIIPQSFGVILVKRGTDHDRYPGGSFNHKSGADRRRISEGFDLLFDAVRAKRADCLSVVLEELSLPQQISLFLNADTLIAQHGAAFVHGHWMPPGGHLIELQCLQPKVFLHFVESIAAARGHRRSLVCFPCTGHRRDLSLTIDDPHKIVDILSPRPCGPK